jgi:aminoglycoside 6'-N-acetyltransferase
MRLLSRIAKRACQLCLPIVAAASTSQHRPMTETARYRFRAATLGDLELLRRWQRAPHVGGWWDSEDQFDEAALADPRVSQWIVSFDRRPFAYMQDYAVHGWRRHHFEYLPEKSRGIDQYIG